MSYRANRIPDIQSKDALTRGYVPMGVGRNAVRRIGGLGLLRRVAFLNRDIHQYCRYTRRSSSTQETSCWLFPRWVIWCGSPATTIGTSLGMGKG